MEKKVIIYCLLICLGGPFGWLQAQTDTLDLPEVLVTASPLRTQPVGDYTQEWDKAQLTALTHSNVAELLQQETGVFVKSYGLGSLATTSVRGGSAGQTLVLWNGLPLQSPMLGLLDLSLLPVGNADRIQFKYGGNTALWGSGAIGGMIAMDNLPDFSTPYGLEVESSIGSFNSHNHFLRWKMGDQTVQSATTFSLQEAANNFRFRPAPGVAERRQSNAALSQHNVLQDLYWRLDDRHHLEVHFWHQQADRKIPPLTTQNTSKADQADRADRIVATWQFHKKQLSTRTRIGWIREKLTYTDEAIGLEATSRFQSLLVESGLQWDWNPSVQFWFGGTQLYTKAWSGNYDHPPVEHRSALIASLKYKKEKVALQLNVREEWVTGDRGPLVPMLGFNYRLSDELEFKGKLGRNYRLPTLNDRFWVPGGNPRLKPEQGWSQELSAGWSPADLQLTLTGFNRLIEDWILWSLQDGQAVWSARNITRVWSRGLEFRLRGRWTRSDWKLVWKVGYDYIRSTNQVDLENPRLRAGEQLIYTPIHQAFARLDVRWKNFGGSYNHSLTGAVKGINDPVSDYQLGYLQLHYLIESKSYQVKLFGKINNLWDAEYQVIERRPMPGIHFQLGFRFEYAKLIP